MYLQKTIILILILTFFSCENPKKGLPTEKENQVIKVEEIETKVEIPKEIDIDFKTFIKLFNKDSLFQVSRVKFPITIKYADWKKEYKYTEETIQKENYFMLDFEYSDSLKTRDYDKYEQFIKVDGIKATIELRGIDNGIYSDYYFEKIDGKWTLKTWIDSST